jgi:hypothetical protein
MSTSRIADLQYDDAATAALGTNSYRLIKQTFQSVCALFFFRTKKWLELCYRLHLCIDSGNRRRYQAIVGLESEEGGFSEDVSKTGS